MKCIPLLSMLPLDSLIKFWSFFQATTRIKISNIWKFEDTALEMVTTHVCASDNKETATNCCFVRRLNLNDFSSKTAKNLFNIGSWKVEFYIFVAHELKQWLTQLRSQRIEYWFTRRQYVQLLKTKPTECDLDNAPKQSPRSDCIINTREPRTMPFLVLCFSRTQ